MHNAQHAKHDDAQQICCLASLPADADQSLQHLSRPQPMAQYQQAQLQLATVMLWLISLLTAPFAFAAWLTVCPAGPPQGITEEAVQHSNPGVL